MHISVSELFGNSKPNFLRVDMNSDPSISTIQQGTTIDAVFMQGFKHSKSQVNVSYSSQQKLIVACLSF